MKLVEISDIIQKWYNVEVFYESESSKHVRFTGAMNKNKPIDHFIELIEKTSSVKFSIADGIGIGIGFTLILVIMGFIRELLGTGAIVLFGYNLLSVPITPSTFMVLPGGAFITIGLLMALVNYSRIKKLEEGVQ